MENELLIIINCKKINVTLLLEDGGRHSNMTVKKIFKQFFFIYVKSVS